jgi:hypothetical protein
MVGRIDLNPIEYDPYRREMSGLSKVMIGKKVLTLSDFLYIRELPIV